MNTTRFSRNLSLLGLFAFLTVFAVLVMVLASTVAAGPQSDWAAYLPHVASPPEPIDSYEANFANDLESWEAVRWKKGTDFNVTHNGGCDGGYCGFLDVDVKTTQTYANVSPLIRGPEPPYTIVFRAKLKEFKEWAQYGVVFGADWQEGACPGDNTDNCFNHYYEFRARFRGEEGNANVQHRIRRIDGMDDDNNENKGKTLLDWKDTEGVDAGDWIEWEIHYGANGEMTIEANGQEQKDSAQDDVYEDDLYFGVGVRAGSNGATEALFDKFSITAE